MSETGLNFGPEWVRALTQGGNMASSPPPSPGPTKFQKAEYRYGREEMLEMYSKDHHPPDDLLCLEPLYIELAQHPLAFSANTEEEQLLLQRGVNSEAVIRMNGRPPINGVGRGRGGSVDRGRGRGRSIGNFYSRGLSYDEETDGRGSRDPAPPGINTRKNYERSQSVIDQRVAWGDRTGGVSNNSTIPEPRNGAVSPRKEQGRASTENWRTRGVEEEVAATDRWRGGNARTDKWGGSRGGWRERESLQNGEWGDESSGRIVGKGMSSLSRSSRPPWDVDKDKDNHILHKAWEDDNLPEWATENTDEKGGSFDAAGAYHCPGWSEDDDQQCQELHNPRLGTKGGIKEKGLVKDGISKKGGDKQENGDQKLEIGVDDRLSNEEGLSSGGNTGVDRESPTTNSTNSTQSLTSQGENSTSNKLSDNRNQSSPLVNGVVSEEESDRSSISLSSSKPTLREDPRAPSFLKQQQDLHKGEDANLDHMHSLADDIVAKLVEEDEPRVVHQIPPPPGVISDSGSPPPEDQWFYTDPQGDIQGPFTSAEMESWYKAGYFQFSLLLRRKCDDKFAQLGDLIKVFGRVPFLPGPAVPHLKIAELNAQKAQVMQAQDRDRVERMQAYLLHQQQIQLRNQNLLQQLQSLDNWNTLTQQQKQQLCIQQLMTLPAIPAPVMPSSGTVQPHSTVSNVPLGTLGNTQTTASSTTLSSELLAPVTTSDVKTQDPIKDLVARMSTSVSNSNVSLAHKSECPLISQPDPTTCVSSENPLQKLLINLQKSSQAPTHNTNTNKVLNPGPISCIPTSATSNNSPEKIDVIQSLMQQLTKIHPSRSPSLEQDEQRRREEEQQKLMAEEKRKLELADRESIKQHEQRLKDEKQKEEEKRKALEERNIKLEEELRKMQEEEAKRIQEENRRKEESRRKLMEQQEIAEANKKREEEMRRQEEEAARRKEEEERKKKEEEKRWKMEEARRQMEEERKQEEERKRREEIQEEMRKIQAQEEERRRMQQLEEEERQRQAVEEERTRREHQHLLQEHLKHVLPAWNAAPTPAPEPVNAPSLVDIQRAQKETERLEKEEQQHKEAMKQRELQKQVSEENRQKNSGLKWAAMPSQVPAPNSQPVKSLLEIQAEEEKELKKKREKEQAERAAAVSHLTLNAAGVWGSATQSLSWASRTSVLSSNQSSQWGNGGESTSDSSVTSSSMWGTNPASSEATVTTSTNSVWNNEHNTVWSQSTSTTTSATAAASNNISGGGFWDNPVSVKAPSKSSNNQHSNNVKSTQNNAKASKNSTTNSNNTNNSNKTNKKKTKDDNEAVKKLFEENITPADNFSQWCKSSLHTMKVQASIDIPTFVGFLAEVESPYEVHDYIRSYLGDSKEVKEFARQYLERRSRARNAYKERKSEDDILAPAPAVNPSANQDFQEVKTRLKKGKKKMQKVDSSILGFNVTSNERMNVGERDYAE